MENAQIGQLLKLGGEVLPNGNINGLACEILSAFEQNNRNIGLVKGAYSKFEIFFVPEQLEDETLGWRMCLGVFDKFGVETKILDAGQKLAEKIGVMFEAVGKTEPENLIGKTLTVFENLDGKIVYSLI